MDRPAWRGRCASRCAAAARLGPVPRPRDSAGNLIVEAGKGEPLVVFVAHLDEIGFVITGIRPDGTARTGAAWRFLPSLFEAARPSCKPGRVRVPGVFLPRDSVGAAPRRTPPPFRRIGGCRFASGSRGASAFASAARSRCRSSFTMLAGTRATGRSFDDRVGCTAQILALQRIDPKKLSHRVIFVFSVREEMGLEGARGDCRRTGPGAGTGARHRHLRLVRLAARDQDLCRRAARLGRRGARADNSSITPPVLVDSLVQLAARRGGGAAGRVRPTAAMMGRCSRRGACPTFRSRGRSAMPIRRPK